jgi:uncharacterized protein (DUF488 family)
MLQPIEEISLPELGRNSAFRAYADHIATEEFAAGLSELLMIAHGFNTAIMCAEILWWRCHRRIIADVLTSLDVSVRHIRDESEAEVHRLGPRRGSSSAC